MRYPHVVSSCCILILYPQFSINTQIRAMATFSCHHNVHILGEKMPLDCRVPITVLTQKGNLISFTYFSFLFLSGDPFISNSRAWYALKEFASAVAVTVAVIKVW